ncbi:MAG: hypothetical protein MUC49_02060 [Raineya sp.]|jgi:hypothetical protein|nr:hypothetical protein [Raineya sp.]
MTDTQITEKQKKMQDLILQYMNEESVKKQPSLTWGYVWFDPKEAVFFYSSIHIKNEVIQPLIKGKKIVFKGIKLNYGRKLLQYTLSEKLKK